MSLADKIYQKSLSLPPEKAREVIDFIDFIKARRRAAPSGGDNEMSGSTSLLDAFEQACLVGCLETDEQLSTNYKGQLDFSRKHGGTSRSSWTPVSGSACWTGGSVTTSHVVVFSPAVRNRW